MTREQDSGQPNDVSSAAQVIGREGGAALERKEISDRALLRTIRKGQVAYEKLRNIQAFSQSQGNFTEAFQVGRSVSPFIKFPMVRDIGLRPVTPQERKGIVDDFPTLVQDLTRALENSNHLSVRYYQLVIEAAVEMIDRTNLPFEEVAEIGNQALFEAMTLYHKGRNSTFEDFARKYIRARIAQDLLRRMRSGDQVLEPVETRVVNVKKSGNSSKKDSAPVRPTIRALLERASSQNPIFVEDLVSSVFPHLPKDVGKNRIYKNLQDLKAQYEASGKTWNRVYVGKEIGIYIS